MAPRNPDTRLALAHMRRILRTRGYSPRTEQTYLQWVERFLGFCRHPSPEELDAGHLDAFLTSLAAARCAPGSRNQAASAIAFYYREVLGSDSARTVERARGRARLPTVLSHAEAKSVLSYLSGRKYLVAALLYGTGMRLTEALGVRVQDLDFDLSRITVRRGKGGKDRVVMLPTSLVSPLRSQIGAVGRRHEVDCELGAGWAPLPGALHRKKPDEGYQLGWQFLFPATQITLDEATGRRGRRPLHPSAVQRAVKKAVRRAGVMKPATCHTFRHSFATELLRDGYDIRVVQELLGHKDIRTTMIYLHVADQMGMRVRSPIDREVRER